MNKDNIAKVRDALFSAMIALQCQARQSKDPLLNITMNNELQTVAQIIAEAREGLKLLDDAKGWPEMSVWQPIETAPKDGTRIMLYRNGHIVFGAWNDERYAKKPRPYWMHDTERYFGAMDARRCPPTHWQPLPEPPEGKRDV